MSTIQSRSRRKAALLALAAALTVAAPDRRGSARRRRIHGFARLAHLHRALGHADRPRRRHDHAAQPDLALAGHDQSRHAALRAAVRRRLLRGPARRRPAGRPARRRLLRWPRRPRLHDRPAVPGRPARGRRDAGDAVLPPPQREPAAASYARTGPNPGNGGPMGGPMGGRRAVRRWPDGWHGRRPDGRHAAPAADASGADRPERLPGVRAAARRHPGRVFPRGPRDPVEPLDPRDGRLLR